MNYIIFIMKLNKICSFLDKKYNLVKTLATLKYFKEKIEFKNIYPIQSYGGKSVLCHTFSSKIV